jgi:hypothetical protein
MTHTTSDYFSEDRLSALCQACKVESAALSYRSLATNESKQLSFSASASQVSANLETIPVFCNVKLFTSTLILLLASRSMLALDAPLLQVLPESAKDLLPSDLLKEITIAQLLAHTHGLASPLEAAAFSSSGFIDIEACGKSLVRLFEPGKYYSYSIIGYVLLGIVIESILKTPFHVSLHSQVFSPLYGNSQDGGIPDLLTPICPSSGKGLALSVYHLARFCEVFLSDHAIMPGLDPLIAKEALVIRVPMPGWTPQIQGSCFGWRHYGNGWYGHNGMNDRHLSYVRINLATQTSLCLTINSNTGSHTLLPSQLFKDNFPELVMNSARQLPIMPATTFSESLCEPGVYGSPHHQYFIYYDARRLKLDISTLYQDELSDTLKIAHSCFLYPSINNVFYLSKPWRNVVFLQLIHDERDLKYHLWDHDKMWPKLKCI